MNTKLTRDPITLMASGVMVLTVILGAITLLTSAGCGSFVDEGKALRAVKDDGYTDASITDRHVIVPGMFGCDDKDSVGFDVKATNVNGTKVKLIVCCGLIKACTIRH